MLPKDVKYDSGKVQNFPELQAMADVHALSQASSPLALIVWDSDSAKHSKPAKAPLQ